MNLPWQDILWHQFGAAIDDLENGIRACPDELWRDMLWHESERPSFFLPEFWYVAYHALFWLDLYLTGTEDGFAPPPPFQLIEQDENGPIPETPYTKEQLLGYLAEVRARTEATITGLTEETAAALCRLPWGEVTFYELQLYSMRHLVGHAAQLNLRLGQTTGDAPDWVLWAGEGDEGGG